MVHRYQKYSAQNNDLTRRSLTPILSLSFLWITCVLLITSPLTTFIHGKREAAFEDTSSSMQQIEKGCCSGIVLLCHLLIYMNDEAVALRSFFVDLVYNCRPSSMWITMSGNKVVLELHICQNRLQSPLSWRDTAMFTYIKRLWDTQ